MLQDSSPRYWSSLACREDPDIGRRGSISGKNVKIAHGLAGTRGSGRKTASSTFGTTRRTFAPTTTSRTPSENSRLSVDKEEDADDYYFFSDEEEERDSDPFTQDPSRFLFIPGIQEVHKEEKKDRSTAPNSESEVEFGQKIQSSSLASEERRLQPQSFNSPGISFDERGESNLFDVLSQLDL